MRHRVIAEGVETAHQLEFLRSQNCCEGQGYYFGKPLAAEQFVALMEHSVTAPPRADGIVPVEEAIQYTDIMQLHTARLCFNCEDVHDQPICPACGSDSFAYHQPVDPGVGTTRADQRAPLAGTAETYRQLLDTTGQTSGAKRWMTGGMVGLAAITMAGWAWRRKAASRGEAVASTIDPLGRDD